MSGQARAVEEVPGELLAKPFSPERLLEAVGTLLVDASDGQHRSHEEPSTQQEFLRGGYSATSIRYQSTTSLCSRVASAKGAPLSSRPLNQLQNKSPSGARFRTVIRGPPDFRITTSPGFRLSLILVPFAHPSAIQRWNVSPGLNPGGSRRRLRLPLVLRIPFSSNPEAFPAVTVGRVVGRNVDCWDFSERANGLEPSTSTLGTWRSTN
jgi:hypothetical protein